MKKLKLKLFLFSTSLILLEAFTPAYSVTLKFNDMMSPKSIESVYLTKFFKELKKKTNGQVKTQIFEGGSLLNGPSTLQGISNGIVDGGFIVPTLSPSALPHAALLADMLPFMKNNWVATGETDTSMLLNCKKCKADFSKSNAVFLAGYGASPWHLMCRSSITSAKELRGRKIRVQGGFGARMAKAYGAVPVNVPPGEIEPMLQRKQISCAFGPLVWLTTLGLMNSVRTVIDYPLGSSHGLGLLVFNKNSLNKLSSKQKATMLHLIPKYIALVEKAYDEQTSDARKQAIKNGVKFIKPGPSFIKTFKHYKSQEVTKLAQDLRHRGVKHPLLLIKQQERDIKMWKKLVTKSKSYYNKHPQAFANLLWNKVYSKVRL